MRLNTKKSKTVVMDEGGGAGSSMWRAGMGKIVGLCNVV